MQKEREKGGRKSSVSMSLMCTEEVERGKTSSAEVVGMGRKIVADENSRRFETVAAGNEGSP